MTPRERFIAALERKPLMGRVPPFELVFFLTMEDFGKVHPSHRSYHQWEQMTEKERSLHRNDMASLYIATAEKFEHSAIFFHLNFSSPEDDKGIILRFYEVEGKKTTATLASNLPLASCTETNLLEEKEKNDSSLIGEKIRIEVLPFEIKTLLLLR